MVESGIEVIKQVPYFQKEAGFLDMKYCLKKYSNNGEKL